MRDRSTSTSDSGSRSPSSLTHSGISKSPSRSRPHRNPLLTSQWWAQQAPLPARRERRDRFTESQARPGADDARTEQPGVDERTGDSRHSRYAEGYEDESHPVQQGGPGLNTPSIMVTEHDAPESSQQMAIPWAPEDYKEDPEMALRARKYDVLYKMPSEQVSTLTDPLDKHRKLLLQACSSLPPTSDRGNASRYSSHTLKIFRALYVGPKATEEAMGNVRRDKHKPSDDESFWVSYGKCAVDALGSSTLNKYGTEPALTFEDYLVATGTSSLSKYGKPAAYAGWLQEISAAMTCLQKHDAFKPVPSPQSESA